MSQKICVLEVNEVPLRIFRDYAGLLPGSHISRLLKTSEVMETLAIDVDPSFLYPSQTWASLNTGAPYREHQIHWYNDPKPAEYPLYWKLLANHGLSVGVVGTLHSSPAAAFAEKNDHYKFVIPDCFASDSYTKPGFLQPFQFLNLQAVSASGRATSVKAPLRHAALTALNFRRYGIRLGSMTEGAALVMKILRKKVNRERLRNLQFPLVADIFLSQYARNQPDLAILFTNHVAANMHRYWYALHPEDYREEIYGGAWRAKYEGEIIAAMELLDRYVGRLMRLTQRMNAILVVVSSMGQEANKKLTPDIPQQRSVDYRLEDVKKFVSRVSSQTTSFQVRSAMVPQYTLAFDGAEKASAAVADMRQAESTMKGIGICLDQNKEALTISAWLDSTVDEFRIGDKSYTHKDLGFVRLEIDDHHSGCHCPEGTLIIHNSKTARVGKPSVDYLEYAPALLRHFGIPPRSYMRASTFSF